MQRTLEEQFLDQFNHSAPTYFQACGMERVRAAVKTLAAIYFQVLPPGADKSAATRQLRESLSTATAAIMQGPKQESMVAEATAKPDRISPHDDGGIAVEVFDLADAFTVTVLDGTRLTMRKSDAERRYGEHLRRIAELERRLLEYRGDYGDVEGVSY